jgi:AraC-like DNA-binding protein
MAEKHKFLSERLSNDGISAVLVRVQWMDPLADVLDLSRIRGALMAHVRAGTPWGIELPRSDGASFHAITAGTAWLRVGDQAPLQLMPGDLVLLPTGVEHRLSSTPDAPCEPFDRRMKQERMTARGDLDLGGGGARTTFVCAAYTYDLQFARRLMTLLPAVLHVPADPVGGRNVAALVELLAGEVDTAGAGAGVASARLIDLLLIAAIRAWLAAGPADEAAPSWLLALREPIVAQTLSLLHERPAERWTLERLARELHVSRATLARRFTEAVGEPPLTYLTRWRMELAARRLRTSGDTVERIAGEVGYSSEFAFNRAFARHQGQAPGRYRRAMQAA